MLKISCLLLIASILFIGHNSLVISALSSLVFIINAYVIVKMLQKEDKQNEQV